MKKTAFLLFLIICFPHASFSQFSLSIEIEELKNNKGNVMLQLFDENEKVIQQLIDTINGKRCSFLIDDLKEGKYAVRFYHDENVNGNMETNVFGKPTEGYGFSNNVTGKSGPPPFSKWLFELNSDKKIILKPVY
jgi:uncharacterized protein (DUF2141 family)